MLKLTTERPTKPGWYFVRYTVWDCMFIWLAEERDGLLVWDDVDDPHPEVALFNNEPDALELTYAGPIPHPVMI